MSDDPGECMIGRTQIHDVISTDGTVINNDIPGPQRNCVPLYDS